jgi:oligopeptide transport system substrate-binding protein
MHSMIVRLLLLVAAVVLLASCGRGESNVASGNRAGILHFGNGSEPQALDPHVATGIPEHFIINALFEGLAVKNPYTLKPEPGVASRWDISEDGRVITFHINPEARWSNGDPMTAADYVWSWQRLLSPALGGEYAYMLFPVKNAQAFNQGKITDFGEVGVKALDKLTLQVTLNERTPYFLQLMDHYSTFAVHRPTIEKFGNASDRYTPWTRVGNMVSNGAFRLKDWQLYRRLEVEKSDTYWDRDRVKLNGIVFHPTENSVSEERMFRVGQLHYTGSVPLGKIPVYQEMADTPYRQAPYIGTYYYLINTLQAPTDNLRVRQALSMAIDRESLNRNVLKGTNIPAYSITPPDTLGYFPPRLFSHDVARARELLAEAGYPNGEGWPGLELTYNTSEDHRKVAVALQQMWKDALNIDITLTNQEWKVYLDSITQMNFQIARRGWIGDYVDPNSFLDLFITGGGNNNTGFADPRYDDLVLRQAPQAATDEARLAIFHEAETLLMEQMPIIPLYTYTSKHLVHPSVSGMPPNLMDSANFKYVSLDKDWRPPGAGT